MIGSIIGITFIFFVMLALTQAVLMKANAGEKVQGVGALFWIVLWGYSIGYFVFNTATMPAVTVAQQDQLLTLTADGMISRKQCEMLMGDYIDPGHFDRVINVKATCKAHPESGPVTLCYWTRQTFKAIRKSDDCWG